MTNLASYAAVTGEVPGVGPGTCVSFPARREGETGVVEAGRSIYTLARGRGR